MRKIRRNKVNQAIEFLQSSRRNGDKWKLEVDEDEKLRKINSHCKIRHQYKTREKQHSIGFSKHTILLELKSHVLKRDWSKVRNLCLLLLQFTTHIEPLVWRYVFILTLYSNINNLHNISEFFKLCIGNLDADRNLILKHLLLLSCNR